MKSKKAVLWILLSVMGIRVVQAQETVFTNGQAWEVGAVSQSLGGAFTGVANDYSALYYNPAGLGQVQHVNIFSSYSHIMLDDKSTFMGTSTSEEVSFTKLGALGVTVPVPTYRGSLVFAFGYHRIRGFGGALGLMSNQDVFIDYTLLFDTTWVTLPYPVTPESAEEMIDGELSQTSFGGAVEAAPGLFFGGSVNFWAGTRDYSWDYTIIRGIYDVNVLGDDWEVMLPDLAVSTYYQEKYSGINFTLGTLFQSNQNLQIGGVIKTPVKLSAKRDEETMVRKTVYPGYQTIPDSSFLNFVDHEIQSPWIFQLGGAVTIGPFMVAGDVELNDYSQVKYKTAPPTGETVSEANREIRKNFRSVLNTHIGGQFTIPGIGLKLRAGYAHYKSPLKDGLAEWDRKVVSIGGGISFEGKYSLDVCYSMSSWEKKPFNWLAEIGEKVDENQFLLSFSYGW